MKQNRNEILGYDKNTVYTNDIVKAIRDYHDWDGPYYQYDNSFSKQIIKEGFIKNGKRFGLWKEYHNNGKIKLDTMYDKAGKIVGHYREYHKNGKLKNKRENYKNYIKGTLYWVNGSIRRIYHESREGELKGLYLKYLRNGNLKSVSLCNNRNKWCLGYTSEQISKKNKTIKECYDVWVKDPTKENKEKS